MLPGHLRIDGSTKSNTLSSISLQPGKLVLESVDSLVDVVQTTIFTVLTQKFQKKFLNL